MLFRSHQDPGDRGIRLHRRTAGVPLRRTLEHEVAPEAVGDVRHLVGLGHQAVDHAIGGIARLHKVYVTRSIPKTRAGKIMRRLLREAVQSGRITSDTTGLEDPDSLAAILEAVQN